MVHSKFSAVGFALSLSLTTVAQIPAQAQGNEFKLPGSVAQGTNVRVDGSSSMTAVNQVLKQQFEKKYPGTQVNLANNGTPQGIQAVLEGKADVAAIGRPLNAEEKSKGLVAVPVGRDKIAILVGANNAFAKSLNISQFAKIFRGEIKNWSEVGGPSLPIRLVDRPDSSDTREAFRSYPVFKQANFATGSTAEKLSDDSTDAVAQKLGSDGISYSTANQLKNHADAKAVIMHGTPPSDSRYPFSQALYYVYKADKASDPAIQSFLGFATAPVGQKAIEQAGVADAVSTAPNGAAKTDGVTDAMKDSKAADAKADADSKPGNTVANAKGEVGSASNNAVKGEGAGGGDKGGGLFGFLPSFSGDGPSVGGEVGGVPNWLWWLFPIGSGAALLWLLGKGRRGPAAIGGTDATGSFVPPGEYNYRDDVDRPDRNRPGAKLPNVGGAIDNTVKGTSDWVGDTTQSAANLAGDAARTGGNLFNNTGAAIAGGAAAAAGAGAAAWAAFGARNGKQSRVVLKARSPQEIEAFWDIPSEQRDAARQAGGEKLALRLYDVTDIDLERQPAHSVQLFECDELTHRQRLPIGLSDRDYLAELGYLTHDQQWLSLGRSAHVRVPQSNTVLGDIAKAGGAAVAGGAAMAGGMADSAKSFLDRDRDNTDEDEWSEDPNARTQTPDDDNFLERMGRRVSDVTSDATQTGGAAIAGGAAAATGAGAAAWNFLSGKQRNSDPAAANPPTRADQNDVVSDGRRYDGVSADVDAGRIVLTPRNGQWAYAYWDVPRTSRALTNREADHNLVLRLYDVTTQAEGTLPERYEQFDVDDLALSCDVPIPASNRSYLVELGYVDRHNHWSRLARSTSVWVPAT